MSQPDGVDPHLRGLAKKRARVIRLPEQLGCAAPAALAEPGPGETCALCHRAMPDTVLEVWLQQEAMTFDDLAQKVTDHPIVIAWFEQKKRKRPRRISKNLVWRLNHQAPWWSGPRPSSPALPVQAAMLEITGLKVADLQNLKPNTDGYACKVRESESARVRRVRREAREVGEPGPTD